MCPEPWSSASTPTRIASAASIRGKNNTVVTIPKGTTRIELRILRGGVTAGSVSGNLKIQLELGNTAHEWMKPDVTSLEGGV